MRNKNVGFLVSGIAIVIVIITLIFNSGLKNIVGQTCSHATCTMYNTIAMQTYFSLAIAGIVLVIGLFLIFTKESERIIIKRERIKVPEKKKPFDLSGLDKDEKHVIKMLQEENGAMFQSDLMERLEIGKVKTTRMLDKLESKQLVERKRRGMNNIVVLIG